MTTMTFEECFRANFARLAALGQAMTGDPAIADELAQESFVRLHRQWGTVANYERPEAWLRRVMCNLLIDHHRSRTSEQEAIHRLASRAAIAAPVAERGDDWSRLIAVLPPQQRLIVTLFYGEDLAIADIATALDLSPNSVKSSLSKARERLRASWEQSDV